MMQHRWTGTISLTEDDPGATEDIHLTGTNSCLPTNAKLSFLSLVDKTRIPLHIICGQRYDVQFSGTGLQKLLLDSLSEEILDRQDTSEDLRHIEGSIAALIAVRIGDGRVHQAGWKTTELLIYAAWEGKTSSENVVNFHALPLSSHLLYQAANYQLPTGTPLEDGSGHINGTFLEIEDLQSTTKRQKLDNLFDVASKPKKIKRQDSQDLARLVPQSRPQTPSLSHADSSSRSAVRQHSRTASLSSTQPDRPRSRGLERVRSSLSRVASTGILSRPSSRGATPCNQEDNDQSNALESKNKKSLSNIVMASMRLRGMSQKKLDLQDGPDDAEYKLMYHNTFKAANFALRGKMQLDLDAEAMRDVVDLLLDLFCGDGDGVSHHGFG